MVLNDPEHRRRITHRLPDPLGEPVALAVQQLQDEARILEGSKQLVMGFVLQGSLLVALDGHKPPSEKPRQRALRQAVTLAQPPDLVGLEQPLALSVDVVGRDQGPLVALPVDVSKSGVPTTASSVRR